MDWEWVLKILLMGVPSWPVHTKRSKHLLAQGSNVRNTRKRYPANKYILDTKCCIIHWLHRDVLINSWNYTLPPPPPSPPFMKGGGGGGRGWVFKIFEKKGGGSDFFHKKGGVGKIGGLCVLFIYTISITII